MKKLLGGLMLVSLLWIGGGQVALATHDGSQPVADCAPPFQLHHLGNHDDHHHGQHRHIGIDLERVDRNGDGYLCVKHISEDKHLHIDNNVRKK